MKNRLFKLIPAFFYTSLLALSACGNNKGTDTTTSSIGSTSSSVDTGEDLELLYFGKPIENNVQPQLLKKSRLSKTPFNYTADGAEESDTNSDYEYEMEYNGHLTLEAYIKNVKRLSFVDIVIYSASTNKRYVFTDGFGEYSVLASTDQTNGVWTTKLKFNWINWEVIEQITTSCVFDTYLEIEEINFLNLAGTVTGTNIAENDIKRVDIHATDTLNSKSHSWTAWEDVEHTCEEYAGRKHRCSICGKEQFQSITEYTPKQNIDPEIHGPLGHIYDGEWEIINARPGILDEHDIFQSVGTCSRCNKTISHSLVLMSEVKINDFSYDLVIPNDIVDIRQHTFLDFDYLKTIRIPTSVEKIGFEAFAYCPNLTDVYFESVTPPSIESGLFDPMWKEGSDFKIHVPVNALEAYENINEKEWQLFAVDAGRLVADVVVSE